jgi:hypothetical protein
VSGIGVLVVGLILCFVGVKSLPIAVLASGFALGWLITEPFNPSLGVAFVVALAAAVVAWLVATFVFRNVRLPSHTGLDSPDDPRGSRLAGPRDCGVADAATACRQ